MRDGESGDDGHDLTESAQWNEHAQKKEQVIETGNDVHHAAADKAYRRL